MTTFWIIIPFILILDTNAILRHLKTTSHMTAPLAHAQMNVAIASEIVKPSLPFGFEARICIFPPFVGEKLSHGKLR